MNQSWKCVYNNAEHFYFARVINDEVMISDGFDIVRRYSMLHINGCAYNGEILWLSTDDNDSLLAIDNADNVSYIKMPVEGTVRILRAVSGQKNCLVVDIPGEEENEYVLFDCSKQIIVTKLPITINCESGRDTLYELYADAEMNTGHIISEYKVEIPARYRDELNDEDILFYADLSWKSDNSVAEITKRIHLNIDYETSDISAGRQTLLSDPGLRFPLFDYYLWNWLKQNSFSTSGKYVVYYCPDICGLIIGSPIGGHVYQIIELPHEIAEESNQFYFDDLRNLIYVIDQCDEIRMYSVSCSDPEAVSLLNQAYDDAYVKGVNLQRRRDTGDLSFWRILKRAVAAFRCESALRKELSDIREDQNEFYITIETPISGVLVLESSGETVASFEDFEYKQEVFLPNTNEEIKLVFYPSGKPFSKIIRIDKNAMNSGVISIAQEFSMQDIESCCDREAARRKLQTQPTNLYATIQLGYIGTAEDYNFILAILEDCYCKSVINHGKDNANVKACINAVLRLAIKYRRKEAITLLKNLLIMVDSSDVADAIRDACVRLSQFDDDKQFRLDLHVKTPIDISIVDPTNDLRIVHTVQDQETSPDTLYYFRSSSGQSVLQIQIEAFTLPLDITVDRGCFHSLRVFEKENDILEVEYMTETSCALYSLFKNDPKVSLTRHIGGPSEYNGLTAVSNKVRIPDFVSTIGKGAFKGQSVTDVVVPARLQAIGDDAFQYSELRNISLPDSVSSIGAGAFKCCRYLEKLVLPSSLNEVSDSMLEQTSITHVEIPGSVERIGENAFSDCALLEEVIIGQGVEEIAAGAFSGCSALTTITIPNSVRSIESRAFDQCSEIVFNGAKGSYAEKYALKHNISFFITDNTECVAVDAEADCDEPVRRGKIIIVSGPSVAGKSNVIYSLISSNKNYESAIMATSRAMRPGETPDISYYFLSKEEFVQGIRKGLFFEYSSCIGNYYGTLKEPIYSSINQGRNVILEMDTSSALQLKKEYPEMILVYILPPDVETVIDRLYNREQDEGLVRERLSVYSAEAYSMLRGDLLLINVDPEKTAARLAAFIDNPNGDDDAYDDYADLIFSLKNGIQQYLGGATSERLASLPAATTDDPTLPLNVSLELREIRTILETLMGGQAIGNDVKGALVDISSGDSDQYSEDTQGTGTALSDNRIASEEIEMMDFSGITFANFIYIFVDNPIFKKNMTTIKDVILVEKKGALDSVSKKQFDRYMSKDEYGSVALQAYDSLFELYESTILDEKKRVEILVRSFSMPVQCKGLSYDEIKNIIIDTLNSKCTSVRFRKRNASHRNVADVQKKPRTFVERFDEER